MADERPSPHPDPQVAASEVAPAPAPPPPPRPPAKPVEPCRWFGGTGVEWVHVLTTWVGIIVIGGLGIWINERIADANELSARMAEAARQASILEQLDKAWTSLIMPGNPVGVLTTDPDRLDRADFALRLAEAYDQYREHTLPYRAVYLYAKGDYRAAVQRAREALAKPGTSPEVRMYLGLALSRIGQDEEATKQLGRAIADDPRNPAFRTALGTIYFASNRLPEAETAFKAAIRANPALAFTHDNLGAVYAEQRRFREAAEKYKDAIRRDDSNPLYFAHLGSALCDSRDLAGAVLAFRHTLSLDPLNSDARAGLAGSCAQSGVTTEGPLKPEELWSLKRPYRLALPHSRVPPLDQSPPAPGEGEASDAAP